MFPMGFLLSFGGQRGGKKKIFFIFPLFQQVPNVFPMSFLLSFGGEGGGKKKIFFILSLFQQVPNVFPMGVPNRTLL